MAARHVARGRADAEGPARSERIARRRTRAGRRRAGRRGGASVDPHQLPFHLRHQALFVGYAPADNPTIAVAVAVEHGGFGASTAGPIARKIFDAYLLGTMPEAPPPTAVPTKAVPAAPVPVAASTPASPVR